jgi:hypothetical protein
VSDIPIHDEVVDLCLGCGLAEEEGVGPGDESFANSSELIVVSTHLLVAARAQVIGVNVRAVLVHAVQEGDLSIGKILSVRCERGLNVVADAISCLSSQVSRWAQALFVGRSATSGDAFR